MCKEGGDQVENDQASGPTIRNSEVKYSYPALSGSKVILLPSILVKIKCVNEIT